ncbi:hypothetical protein J4233_02030 [Candidatus Pacearchaeota archaeon]|nr:hypothetical protein [Candidatus Pacearchaeota archaeon]
MEEIRIHIPDELKELALMKRINWQLVVSKKINEELERLACVERIVSKSKLTQEQADKLSDEVNLSLAKRYQGLLKSKRK